MLKKLNHKVKSFEEVQQITAAKTIKDLELRLVEMYDIAEENFALVQKMIGFDHKLMACRTIKQVLQAVNDGLTQLFNLPQHVFKLTVSSRGRIRVPVEITLVDEVLKTAISNIDQIVTGTKCLHPDFYQWFGEDVSVESFLHLPLRVDSHHFGLLLIGHECPEYFADNISTDCMAMLARSIAITLQRILGKYGSYIDDKD